MKPYLVAGQTDESITSDFTTQISQSRTSPLIWIAGLLLTIGYSWPSDSAAPIPVIKLDGEDLSQESFLTMDSGDRLVVNIDSGSVADIVCASHSNLYLRAQAVIAPDGTRFSGNVFSTCSDRSSTGSYAWRGSVSSPEHHEQFIQILEIASQLRLQNLSVEEG